MARVWLYVYPIAILKTYPPVDIGYRAIELWVVNVKAPKFSITRWKKKTLMFWFTQIHRTFFLVRILIIYKTYYIRMYMYYVLVYQRISCHLRDIFPLNMTNFTILKIQIDWQDIIVWSIASPVTSFSSN